MKQLKLMENLMAPMRDGVRLACNVWRPDDDAAYPAILMRTPYLKEGFACDYMYGNYRELALSGYNIVVQDVRGTGKSEGVLLSSGGNEVNDGYDTIEWVAAQDWCDGNVGMYGLSYFGFTQMAAANDNPPHLRTTCPFQNSALHPLSVTKSMTLGCYHLRWLYDRVRERMKANNVPEEEQKRISDQMEAFVADWPAQVMHLPLREIPAAYIPGVPLLQDFIDLVDGVEDDAYWKEARRPIDLEHVRIPMFHLTGWFDAACGGTIDNYTVMHKNGEELTKQSRLVIGPWGHGGALSAVTDGVDFGQENSGEGQQVREMMKSWFDRWLKGKTDEDYPLVYYYVMGKNVWRSCEEWPPAAEYRKLYLHGGEGKNDGSLDANAPGDEAAQRYVYDPDNPQPSGFQDAQGHTYFADPAVLEDREDVLVYRSTPFEEETEVTGCVKLVLYASTTAVDTDFFCRMSDMDENGASRQILKGIVRAKFRNGRTPELLVPGQVYALEIELGNTSYTFRPGHRVRLDISSSSFPEHNRNLNTGERVGVGAHPVKAEQTIYHDSLHQSHLLLPVYHD